ncbi:MAG: hypothetical protein IJJ01_07535 [Firmicutes bacterium]|nr:hypothetical protein [Bacillota bacterium]
MKATKEAIERKAIDILLNNNERTCDFCDGKKRKICCDWECTKMLMATALEQAEQELSKPTLTEHERVILQNIEEPFQYIARDSDGDLEISRFKMVKSGLYWDDATIEQFPFKKLFTFITWEDEEPYNIEELLGETE